jgi:benzoylformate decarboxylase
MRMMKVAEFLLQTLELSGVRHIFGNPGTTEIPLVRACERRERLAYVVALSEVAAVPMADGYARARRTLGVVNLHVAPGLGNGTGALYTAMIAKTPLLVLIGGQDRRFLHTAPILYGPLEAMAQNVCKAVFGLDSSTGVAATIANAVRAVSTPPFGPVALVCPPDVLEEEIDATPATIVAGRLGTLAASDTLELAQTLCAARSPAFVATEDVHWHDAAAELRALSQLLPAPVYVAPYTGVLPIDADSAAFAGYLAPSFAAISARLAAHDVLGFLGGRTLRTTLYSELKLPQRRFWLGDDPTFMPSSAEFAAAHLVDLRSTLAALGEAVRARRSPSSIAAMGWRTSVTTPAHEAAVFHPTRAIQSILRTYAEALVFDESGLSTSDVRQWMSAKAGDYFVNGSGGIGWALAAAVGGAMAVEDRQVVAIVGDGSALYAAEALWSAANRDSKLLVIVLSNRRYATLNAAAKRLVGHALELFSIEPPAIDFAGLATLYGFGFARARTEQELETNLGGLGPRVARNTLLELVFDAAIEPVTASRHF